MLQVIQSKGRSAAAQMISSRRWQPPSALGLRRLTTDDKDGDKASPTKKLNFDRNILQPAQQGRLTNKHKSSIPRLAARKTKAHLTPISGRAGQRGPPPVDTDEWLDHHRGGGDDNNNNGMGALDRYTSSTGGGGSERDPLEDSLKYVMEDYDPYFAFELMDDKKYYWREEEYEPLGEELDDSILFGPDGNDVFEIEFTKKDLAQRPLLDPSIAQHLEEISRELNGRGTPSGLALLDDNEEESEEEGEARDQGGRRKPRYDGMDPEEWYFQGASDILEAPARDDLPDEETAPQEWRKEIMELAPHHGTGIDGFVQAMQEHPTDYARVSLLKQHPATMREPKPDFPKTRQPHPPLEFVEEHNRFIFVTGLPPLVVNGEQGDLENPVHRSFLEKTVARLVGVDSTQVWPVNRTSAFVGFFTPRAMADALKAGPSEKVQVLLPVVNLLSSLEDVDNPFQDTEPDRVVQVMHIPAGHSPSSLLRTLFPPDSEVETIFGSSLDASKNIYFLSATKVLIRFSSAEEAASAVVSQFWKDRLADVGLYPVRFFRARRELVHAGFTGPVKDDEVRVMGPRLIVDGDMPSKDFFQSHPRCLHVRNLDPVTTTPEMLTEIFQPYSELPRQVGSVELVTCEAGMPTDRAYIGFDTPGEAEACIEACKGLIKIGDRRLTVRLVHDRTVPHTPLYRAEKRPARSVEELWDDLDNWEKYIDPADIKYLEQHGVSKIIVDEALRRIRRNNPTFGPLDQALRSEAIEPDTEPGSLYKEIVQLYVQTLKECVATPDNVGPMYEALHLPDEPIDLSIFDDWEKRKAEIERSRARQ